MATNFNQVSDTLGVNLEGNEPASAGVDGTVTVPRVPVLTPVMISGNRTAIYVIAFAALNPSSTCALQNLTTGGSGTVAATTATADKSTVLVSLNIATAATGDFIWARTSNMINN